MFLLIYWQAVGASLQQRQGSSSLPSISTTIIPSTAVGGDSVNTSTASAIVSKANALATDSVSLTRQGRNEEITRKLKQVLARLNLSQEQKGQLESYHTKRERIAELSDQKVSSMCELKYLKMFFYESFCRDTNYRRRRR